MTAVRPSFRPSTFAFAIVAIEISVVLAFWLL